MLRKPLLPRFSGAFRVLSFLFYTGITQNNNQNNSVQPHSTTRISQPILCSSLRIKKNVLDRKRFTPYYRTSTINDYLRNSASKMKPGKFTCKGNPVDPNEIGQLSVEACKKRLAELSKGLAHPARVEIVRMLENKPLDERCVCGDIVNALPLAQSSVSQHLKVLKETGWVQGEIDGPRVCYCSVEGIMEYYLALIKQSLKGE